MLHLIPAPLHRAGLRVANRLRNVWRRIAKRHRRGVSLVVLDAEERVLLVRHSYGSGAWALPGGGLKRDEEPEAGARRELREELGCDVHQLALAGKVDDVLHGAPHTSYVFAVRVVGEPVPDGRELVDAHFFAPRALPPGMSRRSRRHLTPWLESRLEQG